MNFLNVLRKFNESLIKENKKLQEEFDNLVEMNDGLLPNNQKVVDDDQKIVSLEEIEKDEEEKVKPDDQLAGLVDAIEQAIGDDDGDGDGDEDAQPVPENEEILEAEEVVEDKNDGSETDDEKPNQSEQERAQAFFAEATNPDDVMKDVIFEDEDVVECENIDEEEMMSEDEVPLLFRVALDGLELSESEDCQVTETQVKTVDLATFTKQANAETVMANIDAGNKAGKVDEEEKETLECVNKESESEYQAVNPTNESAHACKSLREFKRAKKS